MSRLDAVRRLGWILIAVCLVAVGLWVVAQALIGAGSFEHWAGWANILALPAGAIGTVLVIFDRIGRRPHRSAPNSTTDATEDQQAPTIQHITANWGGIAQGTWGPNSGIVNHGGQHSRVWATPTPPPRSGQDGQP